MKEYQVGEIAKSVGVNVETLRYYEKIKLMPKPKRKESRYRVYDDTDLKRLKFIVRAKELGFTLKEIKELLNLKIESSATCGDVKHLAEHKLTDIENRIKDLMNMKKVLTKLVHQCIQEEVSADECPILEVIEYKVNDGDK
ncbi:MAG: Zn(2+)-responsive transcriptional regulator [Melioribacteraceae bacterium]|nr:Zn(2+)-responsive transcriptional regulator [Melioribacteraceae bacterium]MCF8355871.1 Zn(2+)-responsive transcriptional regulator [Melioribacteraceae bacterium]MCF8393287.1 Zn(2+)-responsive transcriptional regulator [Melioribacteraceae bacterium]MCF8419139.1 Zn(2+)-responsive transcriptional regulator [Melioribacteraceae bacterium]